MTSPFADYLDKVNLPPTSSPMRDLWQYTVPMASDDPTAGCSIKSQAPEPFHITKYLKKTPENQAYIYQLDCITEALTSQTQCDWVGIYKRYPHPTEPYNALVKLAYRGEYSRAEFPLTEEFAKASNNSTVGLSGTAVLIQSVAAHSGAYYVCDTKVNSELCVPIFSPAGNVIGIIDTEAFAPHHFTDARIHAVAHAAHQLTHIL